MQSQKKKQRRRGELYAQIDEGESAENEDRENALTLHLKKCQNEERGDFAGKEGEEGDVYVDV